MIGGKASGLRRLEELGFRVPPFMVIEAKNFSAVGQLSAAAHRRVKKWLVGRGACRFAVRSSAAQEDSATASFAGLFLTKLDVAEWDLADAIQKVWQSKQHPLGSAYRDDEMQMSVIIQEMIQPRISGVAFSRSPLPPSGDVVAEAGEGLGVGVVEGAIPTQSLRWDRWGRRIAMRGPELLSESEASELFAAVLNLEKLFGYPVDIEWSFDSQGLCLLQARPITSKLPGLLFLTDHNLAESYAGQCSPLTCDFVRLMYQHVFTDCARFLGASSRRIQTLLPFYQTMVEEVSGHLYYNMQSYAGALLPMPGGVRSFANWRKMVGVPDEIEIPFPRIKPLSWAESLRSLLSLLNFALRQDWIMKKYLKRAQTKLEGLDKCKVEFSSASPVAILRALFTEIDQPQELALGILNDFFIMKDYRGGLEHQGLSLESVKPQLAIEDLRQQITSAEDLALLNEIAEMETCTPKDFLSRVHNAGLRTSLGEFLKLYGSRCFGDLKLETQTFRQNIVPLCQLLLHLRDSRGAGMPSKPARENRLGKSIRYREAARLLRTRYFEWVREMVLEFSHALLLENEDWAVEDVFYLRLDELNSFMIGNLTVIEIVSAAHQRRRETPVFADQDFPNLLVVDENRRELDVASESRPLSGLVGTLVAGDRGSGQVLVVRDPRQIPFHLDLEDYYLVTPTTDPAWVYLLGRCKGIISERGNSLSHLAIIAREMKKTMIVQADGACDQLKSQQRVSLRTNGSIEVIAER